MAEKSSIENPFREGVIPEAFATQESQRADLEITMKDVELAELLISKLFSKNLIDFDEDMLLQKFILAGLREVKEK
jgi:hypothetical protein